MASVIWSTYPNIKVPRYPDNSWVTWQGYAPTTSTILDYDTLWGKWSNQSNSYKYVMNTISTSTTSWDNWNTYHPQKSIWRYVEPMTRPLPDPAVVAQRDAEMKLAIAKRREDAAAAKAKAEILLLDNLDQEQRHEYVTLKRFHVRSQHGKRYRVMCDRGHHNNVFEIDPSGKVVKELCGSPRGAGPNEDKFLGQKLALELAESEFLARANVWDLQGYTRELCDA